MNHISCHREILFTFNTSQSISKSISFFVSQKLLIALINSQIHLYFSK